MKTLVLGGAGFLGGHVVPLLLESGHNVTIQDIVPPEAAGRLKTVIKDVHYVWKSVLDTTSGDVRGFDSIVHLAAQGDAPLAVSSPRWTYTLNLDSTLALVEAVRHLAQESNGIAPKIVFMSSDSVYGRVPPERLPIDENQPMQPTSAYGASKAAAELLLNSCVHQWNLPIVILRSTSIYGEGSRMKQVIPIFISQALKNRPITIEGNGSQTRDFNYVKNVASAILRALEPSVVHGTWNIGSGKEITIKNLARLIIKLTGSKSDLVETPWRPGEKGVRLYLSLERAKKELDYSPTYSQEEGLQRTMKWIEQQV